MIRANISRILFIVTVSMLSRVSFAAGSDNSTFTQGTWDLGIGLDASSLDITPSIGYFFVNNVEGIFHFDYQNSTLKGDGDKVEDDALAFGVDFAYVIPAQGSLIPRIKAGVSYASEETTSDGTDIVDAKATVFDVGASLGMLVGRKSSVDFGVTYSTGTADENISDVDLDVTGWETSLAYHLYFN